ncbi:3-phosphoshikimate 1-carboxyvinyltransferase [Actinokineospora sp.]|uniref:3-phosphoshikimate 1-carboxyvinyltransferase n=1 Tax=Actinokineospora sp. TaxID=1872133 RepID=UPI004037D4C4
MIRNDHADERLRAETVTIRTLDTVDRVISVAGSKSYTNRYIAMASLCGKRMEIENALLSDDTTYFTRAIEAFGHVRTEIDTTANRITVTPTGQPMRAPSNEVFVGGAGTPLRFLLSMAGHAPGTTVITGNSRMRERPMGDLVDALPALGVPAVSLRGNGSPPISVSGGGFRGGRTKISGATSSQFTSSLLINAVAAEVGVEVELTDELISKPYVDMTVAAMAAQGVTVDRDGYRRFRVAAGQSYAGGLVLVEPDASGMSYFLCAAAVLGGSVTIPGISGGSVQGDIGLVDVLVRMGCTARWEDDSVTLTGGDLRGIDVDMDAMPDVVPSLAIVAAFATGTTRIRDIASLRVKECDRIAAVATELGKMAIEVEECPDALIIHGGTPKPALISTYDDHRIAMSFAIAGLRVDGVVIEDPGCVAKSFPAFWQTLDGLFEDGRSTR